MDSLDIQVVDSLTVNLNQEDYSTEGQVLNSIDVYVEDEQLLFDAALTLDSINLYTRETPDTINIKEITDGISKLESLIQKTSKEATLLAKVAELKEALNTIPNLSLLYSARFEKNDDGEDTYSMVLPIVAGVIANEDGETVTIKL